ncbi:MAG: hypothetical protein QM691_13945 [Opitutaceae bacterium]
MNKHRTPPGRMTVHGTETGEISDVTIEERAREIALLAGRDEPTAQDRKLALRELQGRLPVDESASDDSQPATAITRDPSEPPSVPGHQVSENPTADPEDIPKRLVEEGVEEAQHEQMIAARRRKEP